ncbi:MAG: hypothetical protein ACLPTF_04200 [Steroidobacteraceae bacterium]
MKTAHLWSAGWQACGPVCIDLCQAMRIAGDIAWADCQKSTFGSQQAAGDAELTGTPRTSLGSLESSGMSASRIGGGRIFKLGNERHGLIQLFDSAQ